MLGSAAHRARARACAARSTRTCCPACSGRDRRPRSRAHRRRESEPRPRTSAHSSSCTLFGAMAAGVWIEFLARPGGSQKRAKPVCSRSHHRSDRSSAAAARSGRYAEITRFRGPNRLGPSLGLAPRTTLDGKRPPAGGRRLRLALEECGGMFRQAGPDPVGRARTCSRPTAICELSRSRTKVACRPRPPSPALLEERARPSVAETFPCVRLAADCGGVHRARLYRAATAGRSPVDREGEAPGPRRGRSRSTSRAGRGSQGQSSPVRPGVASTTCATSWGSSACGCARSSNFRFEGPPRATPIAAGLPDNSRVYVPAGSTTRHTSRVLVMEWLDGTSVPMSSGPTARQLRARSSPTTSADVPRTDAPGRRVSRRSATRGTSCCDRRPPRA